MTGSWTLGPGSIWSSVGTSSPVAAGVEEKETYWFNGRVLVTGRRLHRGDDLAGDAQLGEVTEARLAVGAEVTDRFVEPDEALLDEVVGVSPGQEVGGGLQPYEAVVAADQPVVRKAIALLGEGDQEPILDLYFWLRLLEVRATSRSFPGSPGSPDSLSGALLPGAKCYVCLEGLSTSGSALCGRELRTVMKPLSRARPRFCKISYSSAAAAAPPRATPSAAHRQRDQLIAGACDARAQATPSLPSTSTTPPA